MAVIDNGRPRKNANPDGTTSLMEEAQARMATKFGVFASIPSRFGHFRSRHDGWIRLDRFGLPDPYAMRYLVGHGNGGTVITDPGWHLKFGQCGSSNRRMAPLRSVGGSDTRVLVIRGELPRRKSQTRRRLLAHKIFSHAHAGGIIIR